MLDSLRAQGLTFIYNTQLVPPQMRVLSEPSARGGVAMAEEILAAHGLGVRRVTAGVFAVVPGGRKIVAPAPAPAAAPPRIEEIVVQTSRYALRSEFSAAETLLTSNDIQSLPSLGEEPLRAVQRLPGVAGNGFSSLGAVRGGEPNETAIVLDGLRLYEPFHLKNFLSPVSLLDSRVIRSLQVYSGGFPVIHGDRMSAIIDAATIGPEQPTYYEAGLSLFHANLLGSVQFDEGRGRGLASFRRSNLGELAQFSEQDFGKPEYLDGLARLDYRLNDASRFSVEYLASNDRIVALRNSATERAETEYRNNYLWGTFQHDWNDGARSRLIVSYTDISNEREGRIDEPGRRGGSVHDFRNFHVVGLRVDNEFRALGLEHRLGFEVRRLWGRYDYRSNVRFEAGLPFPSEPSRELRRAAAPKPDGFESAAWWDGQLTLDDRWTLQAGVRVDAQTYDGSGDHEQIAPRLNVLYAWNDATRIRATWGRFHQAQAINELQVEDGVDRFQRAQHADQGILAVDHTFAHGLDLRVEAYRKVYKQIRPRFENLFNPLVLLPETEFDRVMVAPSSARAEGVEVLLRWDSGGPWRAWIGYTWSQASDTIEDRRVPRSWDQKHAINAGVGWASGPWSVAITDTFHTGWPITTMTIVETADGHQQPFVGERNAARLGDYNSLDLRVTRTYALPRGALDVFFEASNLLSRQNECCVEYTISRAPDGSLSLREEVDHWLPLVPSIGVLWRY
ncbi:MAG TPA: TonB-dependent receptor [Steroidobacter sp.]|uniref:TonB-dependent receptor plug domain-containing protein n=1 Tax=Steroidobacter sp. TaxID=1978227 RepID=UPI002ED7CCC7